LLDRAGFGKLKDCQIFRLSICRRRQPCGKSCAPIYIAIVPGETFHHNVYVILLDPAVLRHPSILRLNPKRNPAKSSLYVGMTGLPVEHRFDNHKRGYKSSWVVEKYGVRLLPELYAHLNPMPFEAAVQMEMELAEDLRTEGYTVAGGK
jgi:predicted GIY-YIG superfamily endonuclease